ncbi:MAG: helix-turn-helix domain-containing protein [Hyphomicrobium sp.]
MRHERLDQGPTSAAHIAFEKTSDIDDQAALLRGWNQSYAQLSSGRFSGSIAEARFAGVHLFVEETGSALYQTGELPSGICAVGLPIDMRGPATFCGAACGGPGLHVFSGRGGFEYHTPDGLVMGVVALADEDLAEALSGDEIEALRPSLTRPHLRRASAGHVVVLRDLLTGIFHQLRTTPHLVDDPATALALKRTLASNLAAALIDERADDALQMAPSRRWQIVAAAREMILQSPDSPLTVAELCRASGVSRRTLQYCFQDVLGIGPATFLRAVRLDGARRLIKTSNSVTEAAAHWGFWHFGRFAHDYRAMFGELPSETFRRFHGADRRGALS